MQRGKSVSLASHIISSDEWIFHCECLCDIFGHWLLQLVPELGNLSVYNSVTLLDAVSVGARMVGGGFFGEGQGSVRSFSSQEVKDLPVAQCSHEKDVGVFCAVAGMYFTSHMQPCG